MKTLSYSQLREKYNDPSIGLIGQNAFAQKLLRAGFVFEGEDLERLYNSEASISLNRPAIHTFPRRHIQVNAVDEIWGADLMAMPQFVKENDNTSYFLVVIDFLSKYLFVEPLTNARSETVSKAFQKIFRQSKRKPQKLNTDMGSEFKKDTMKMLASEGVEHYMSTNETKVPIAERVIRTLKGRIGLFMDSHSTHRYIDSLPELINNYNNTRHSTIKMTPVEALLDNNRDKLMKNFLNSQSAIKQTDPKYQVGDQVRISIKKGAFEKEITHKWSRELFLISEVLPTQPPTYKITDKKQEEITGSFYEQEIQKIGKKSGVEELEAVEILKRRIFKNKKQVYVSFPDGSKEWINESELSTI